MELGNGSFRKFEQVLQTKKMSGEKNGIKSWSAELAL